MPVRKKPVSKLPRKRSLRFFLSLIGLTLLVLALPVAYILVKQNQDVRQQAAVYNEGGSGGSGGGNNSGGSSGGGNSGGGGGGGSACAEEHVNTQFRMYEEGTDKPWTDGDKMVVKVGDKIDLNCFAKTGSALLSNGKITLKIDGVTTEIPASSVINDGRSLKAYQIAQGGVHAFTCANTANCSNTDSLNVPKTEASVQLPGQGANSQLGATRPTQEPSGHCLASIVQAVASVADLNKDCSVDLKDYDLFLSEFIKNL